MGVRGGERSRRESAEETRNKWNTAQRKDGYKIEKKKRLPGIIALMKIIITKRRKGKYQDRTRKIYVGSSERCRR